jgi:hypothetical protein
MTDDWDSFINGLVENPEPVAVKHANNEKQFPCGQCAGTGLYQGARVHQEKKHCFACKGKGYFKTDPRKLQKQREARAKKKSDLIVSAMKANVGTGLLEQFDLYNMLQWNDFARSMYEQHCAGKEWSEKQIATAQSMIEKTRISREKREAEAVEVNLTPIIELFANAKASGYKRPVYRAEGLVISLAPATGVNAGALYIKDTDKQYLGKVVNGRYIGSDAAKEPLANIAEDPREAAIRYGRQTGSCACCGRELTNKASIELGIGPICAEKWGLM